MNMRKSVPFGLVALLLLQIVMITISGNVVATEGRGGSSDDFYVQEISYNSSGIETWYQPDGSMQVFVSKGDIVEIDVEVKRGGSALQGSNATVTVEIVHPIGFVMNSTSWTTIPLLGSQSYTGTYTWEAGVAHSYLNVSTNELSGGVIIRATVNNPADDRNENDVMESTLPIAVSQDDMEAEGDPRDGAYPTAAIPTFYGASFPVDGSDANGLGDWREDSSGGANGIAHWRHSNSGADYQSNSRSRLVYAFRGSQTCDANSMMNGGMSQTYQQWMCVMQLNSAGYMSAQLHAKTYGTMGAGDFVALELWRGNGAPESTLKYEFKNEMPSTTPGVWTNISWDPTEELGGHSWGYGIIFQSDSSGAASGMHVDDFVMFGIEKVSKYTLDIDCDDPIGGYTTAPNNILTLHCLVTNNGYQHAQFRVQSNVSNLSWMNPSLPMIRIDSANPNQHGTNVLIPPIPGGNVTEMWINLSIPAGSDVQQQVWEIWWTDAGGTQLGELGRITADIAVTEQYGVHLSSTAPLVAATMMPGETTSIPFKLQNAGNRVASYAVTANFQDSDWSYFITDNNDSIVQMPIPLTRGEEMELRLNVTAPSDSSPGEMPFSLRAVCPSCGQSLFGNDVISKKIVVPVYRSVELFAEETDITAQSNGVARVVYIDLYNKGNADESYTLELMQSNWRLESYLSSEETSTLDAWDGETTLALNLPMPIGLAPGLYTATIVAKNVDDDLVRDQIVIYIDVQDTAAVSVSDQEADQSYIPGDVAQSMRFEVFNQGNKADRFAMSMNLPAGMNAAFEQLSEGNMTPLLEPGESYNVTVKFSFEDGTNGQLLLNVIATSENDPAVSNSGKCTYRVGSQNWLRLISTESTIIDEAGRYEVVVTLRNQYTEGQSVSMSIDQNGTNRWYGSSIASTDREFWLTVNGDREVTVVFEVQSSSLKNLESEFVETSVTLWAISNSVEDAASLDIPVTLKRTSSDSQDNIQSESSTDWVGIAIWVVGGGIIVALLGVLLVVLNSGEEEEETNWLQDGYEDNISATYGAVAAAPTIPAAEPAKFVPEIVEPVAQIQSSGPPLPATGLPEGWTMEQWQHYGQQWLDSQN